MKERIIYFGRNENYQITKVCLQELIKNHDKYSELLVIVSDDNHGKEGTLEGIAKSQAIEVWSKTQNEVNNPNFVSKIRGYKPTKIIVVQFPKIFRDGLIQSCHGILNVHRGWPYRGGSIDQRVIIDGCSEYSIVLHHIDRGIDTGNIIHKITFGVQENETGYSLDEKVTKYGLKLFKEGFIPLLGKDLPEGKKQDLSKTKYASKKSVDIQPDACNMSAEEIEKLVRAFNHPRKELRRLVQEPNLPLREVQVVLDYGLMAGEILETVGHRYIGTIDKALFILGDG